MNFRRGTMALTGGIMLLTLLAAPRAMAAEWTVQREAIEDRKAVLATVEPLRQLIARARIGGTIVSLKVKEGDRVDSGAELAVITDPKLLLQKQGLDARMKSQEANRDQAQLDFDRISELQKRGVSTVTQLNQARTQLDVAERTLSAMRSDREVVSQQIAEGAVFAPGAGRVLTVPVSEGRVVLAGETIATLAEDKYILRLQLPERHAQFMRAGDKVRILSRGKSASETTEAHEGRVVLVYPEIQGGRVIADVEMVGIGNYFVGERTRVDVATGKREAILVPSNYLYRRAGVDFVKIKGGAEIVVQPGEQRDDRIEILSGLKDGDVLVAP